jgi:hypothetical protein
VPHVPGAHHRLHRIRPQCLNTVPTNDERRR